MTTTTLTLPELLAQEDWELARQVLIYSPEFAADRVELENEFGIDFSDLGAVVDLPTNKRDDFLRRMQRLIEAKMEQYRDDLYEKVCVEMDYCNQRNSSKWKFAEYGIAVFDVIFGQGALALLAILMKKEMLDRLCRCSEA